MVELIQGDIFEHESECMVNAWNRNFIPWFLLLSHGISGQLKKKAGYKPFNELLNKGILKSGDAVLTVAKERDWKLNIYLVEYQEKK